MYCKTGYFRCILISWFWNVEISLHFNLAFSRCSTSIYQALMGKLNFYGYLISWFYPTREICENLMHAKNVFYSICRALQHKCNYFLRPWIVCIAGILSVEYTGFLYAAYRILLYYKQGWFVTGVLSTALATPSGECLRVY